MSLHVAGSRRPAHRCTCTPDGLDDRDLAIVAGLAQGREILAIAAELHHTAASVSTFIARARRKVGARTREQLVATAFRDRLLGFDRDGRVVVTRHQQGAA